MCHFCFVFFCLCHLSILPRLAIDAYMSKQTKYVVVQQIRRNMACINIQTLRRKIVALHARFIVTILLLNRKKRFICWIFLCPFFSQKTNFLIYFSHVWGWECQKTQSRFSLSGLQVWIKKWTKRGWGRTWGQMVSNVNHPT